MAAALMRGAAALWLVACAPADLTGTVRQAPPGDDTGAPMAPAGPGDTGLDSAADTWPTGETAVDDSGDTGRIDAPCPADMVHIDAFCVDRYEASIAGHSPYDVPSGGVAQSVEGAVPQGYISGDVAAAACAAAGKRLCALEEWLRACQGPAGSTWPYGDVYDPTACNDSRAEHPIVTYWGSDPNRWDSDHMNDPGINQQPDTVDPSGANPGCVSAEGVYDLHGNLHEWIDDPAGTFKGGFYADGSINGPGCTYTTTAHDVGYHDYSTGFRCCADPR